ncbi:MAG: hypothetical protein QXK97_04910 [Acidilobaceae archaeon]
MAKRRVTIALRSSDASAKYKPVREASRRALRPFRKNAIERAMRYALRALPLTEREEARERIEAIRSGEDVRSAGRAIA